MKPKIFNAVFVMAAVCLTSCSVNIGTSDSKTKEEPTKTVVIVVPQGKARPQIGRPQFCRQPTRQMPGVQSMAYRGPACGGFNPFLAVFKSINREIQRDARRQAVTQPKAWPPPPSSHPRRGHRP